MINRVDFQRAFNYGMEAEERRKRQPEGQVGREDVRVDLSQSQGLMSSRGVDYEDLSRKVETIRRQLESDNYQVSPEKILQGLEKFFSSR
ncbi:MAG: hypothetical protein N3C57_05535 [Aquificaceae bacterium]|nr:hypothetical protein [Aquificaceae bacterium]